MADVTKLKTPKLPPRFPDGFDIGGVVKLRSGGCLLTITSQLKGEPLAVQCEWMAADFYPMEKTYPVSCLRLATQDEIDDMDEVVEFTSDESQT